MILFLPSFRIMFFGLTFLFILHVFVVWWRTFWSACQTTQPVFHRDVDLFRYCQDQSFSVSIIIPAWNDRSEIQACIASLANVKYPPFEAIIVAGGMDGTYEAAISATHDLENFQVVQQMPFGKNAALNQGLRQAQGEWIVLLDADSIVSPGWLEALITAIPNTMWVANGNFLPIRRTQVSQVEQMEKIAANLIHRSTILQGSGSIMCHRSVVEKIGGFPESVNIGVDWDLDQRLKRAGYATIFVPQALLLSERPATLSEFWNNETRWRKAHLLLTLGLSDGHLSQKSIHLLQLYLYSLAWLVFVWSAIIFLLVILPYWRNSDLVWQNIQLYGLFWVWIILRRLALVGQVSFYTRTVEWFRYIPGVVVCLFMTLASCLLATITFSHRSRRFKGPRPHYDERPTFN